MTLRRISFVLRQAQYPSKHPEHSRRTQGHPERATKEERSESNR